MSAGVRTINLRKTEAVEWTFDVEDGSDEVSGSLSYTDDFEGWKDRAPSFKSPHPDYPGLKLKKISATRVEGLQVKVKLDYKDTSSTAEYPGREPKDEVSESKRYSIEAPTTEEPLLTFHGFALLSDAKKQALQELMQSAKTKEDYEKAEEVIAADEIGTKVISKIRKGIEAYLNPGIVWVERYRTKNLASLELSKVGNIFETVPGNPPDIGSRTWLYVGLTGNQDDDNDGEYWSIERRWQASERGGWDEDLYSEESEGGGGGGE